ncbi:dihydropteroate synthase [Yonghaparkia sp. Soil809]|uniref:dihydropteroate synthase n=1 Tax=Yonghaparkia sp. Soil809 TaxID=1736417 RepID=UPI0006FF2A04|nr:dihydropteroate synthase [Yonghaparkia sp. Soil809]KRF33433.1 dihydropteroate synthase [Yonghaparkia sp. Soil809]
MSTAPGPVRPEVWGVLNVTPDSFSDGGRYLEPEAAVAQARRLVDDGADVIDVGGESTRPGAEPVSAIEETARVVPVVRALAAAGIRVSIDTLNASTARAAVEAGASIVNDVSGGLEDPAMLSTIAALEVDYVAMHWRGRSDRWDAVSDYADIVTEVRDELRSRADAAIAAGIAPERLWLDPGLGFAKRGADNWALLRGMPALAELGFPLLVGASRKRFLGALLPEGASVDERDLPTAVVSALCADAGVRAVRVHDAAATSRALAVWAAWRGVPAPVTGGAAA